MMNKSHPATTVRLCLLPPDIKELGPSASVPDPLGDKVTMSDRFATEGSWCRDPAHEREWSRYVARQLPKSDRRIVSAGCADLHAPQARRPREIHATCCSVDSF